MYKQINTIYIYMYIYIYIYFLFFALHIYIYIYWFISCFIRNTYVVPFGIWATMHCSVTVNPETSTGASSYSSPCLLFVCFHHIFMGPDWFNIFSYGFMVSEAASFFFSKDFHVFPTIFPQVSRTLSFSWILFCFLLFLFMVFFWSMLGRG